MKRNLQDMAVVITGASAGIGEALARVLSAGGARLVLSARRRDRLDALNTMLGGRHTVVPADVSRREDCDALIAASFAALGRIDTLVLNAGYGIYPRVHDTPPDDARAIFATNFFGTTDCVHAAVPRMLKQDLRDGWRGQVMIVSSIAARRAVPYLGFYSATKAAQLSIAEAMRVELSPQKLAVTSVHPAMTRTEFGKVAEQGGGIKLPRGGDRFTQTAEHVARRMAAAIARPRPELWPSRPTRVLFPMMGWVPGWIDRGLALYRRRVEAENRGPGAG